VRVTVVHVPEASRASRSPWAAAHPTLFCTQSLVPSHGSAAATPPAVRVPLCAGAAPNVAVLRWDCGWRAAVRCGRQVQRSRGIPRDLASSSPPRARERPMVPRKFSGNRKSPPRVHGTTAVVNFSQLLPEDPPPRVRGTTTSRSIGIPIDLFTHTPSRGGVTLERWPRF